MAWASKLANHNDITGPEGGNALRFFLFFKKILIFDNYAGLLVTGTRGAIVVIEGRRVTLFPNFKSSEQEQRLVSMLLRVMELVPSFANDLLRPIGVSVSRTASTKYLAEVTLSQESKLRPDGFIRIRDWKAIVEAKTGNNKVDDSQIKNYINLVRGTPINAIITISNEMVANPQFHPSTTLSKIE